MATLTYVYAESSAVLGPLSPEQHPGGYDLCSEHSGELTVPQGWELIRLPGVDGTADEHEPDDIMALARAVREMACSMTRSPPPAATQRQSPTACPTWLG